MTLIIQKLPEMVSFVGYYWSPFYWKNDMCANAYDTMLSGEKDTKAWV